MERNDFRVWEAVLVRWGDMDALGHVNNARYFTYCESARMRYFQEIGLEELEERGRRGPAVVSANCNFRRQLRYPARLEVGVRVTRIGTRSFTLEYGVFPAGEGEVVADGTSVAVWLDYEAGKAVPLPAELKERIRELDGVSAT